MAFSVRLDPALEARIDQAAKRLGLTRSDFVRDALERALGVKHSYALLKSARSLTPMGNRRASENVSAKVKAKLRAKRISS